MKGIYSEYAEKLMRDFFDQLPERNRRYYAGLESLKLGHGGIAYISDLLNIDRKTVRRGRNELTDLVNVFSGSRQRKAGGGRKKNFRR